MLLLIHLAGGDKPHPYIVFGFSGGDPPERVIGEVINGLS
jgi:hypothetical protein